MSTRGAYGFRVKGRDKITYNHGDSYPDYLGRSILDYISETPLEMMREVGHGIILVNPDSQPSPELIEKYKGYADLGVYGKTYKDWYCLLRKTQGDLFPYNNCLRHMINFNDFLYDSLFCEWAYIINLDTETFEGYRGLNKNPAAKGRYASKKIRDNNGYLGVTLINSIPIAEISELKIDDYLAELDQLKK